uniref:Uncharacterized protein n=1 Tax=Leersia perrieri TaxID=77586 RepID=A0A0D9WPG6_9ORYZ
MNHHVDQNSACQGNDVNGCGYVPAASSSICTHEAKQIQYHGYLQYAALEQRLIPDQNDDDQGRHKGCRIAVEEHLVTFGLCG